MNDRPYLLILMMIAALGVAIAAAWYFGGTQQGPIAGAAATQTFRAKAGTQRENARAIISDREHIRGKEGTSTDPVDVWGHIGEDGDSQPEVDSWQESRQLAEEVLNDLSIEEGMAVLTAELERTEHPSEIYAAMATLQARSKPYNEQRVEDAFALALSTAATPEERLDVIYRHAKVYLEQGRNDAVLELLERTRPETATFNPRFAEIEVMRANAMMSSGDTPGAITTLEDIVHRDDVETLLNDETFESVYRQAGARLVRIYKETGNAAEADRLARTLRSRLREDSR